MRASAARPVGPPPAAAPTTIGLWDLVALLVAALTMTGWTAVAGGRVSLGAFAAIAATAAIALDDS